MTNFKELFNSDSFRFSLENPSASLTLKDGKHSLSLQFDTKDTVLKAAYSGAKDPWMSSLCFLAQGKTLNELRHLSWKNWEEAFQMDQSFWDLKKEFEDVVFFKPLELLNGCLNLYSGRDYLYKRQGDLICRCFGVRESDVIEHIQKEQDPTYETLSLATKAGMGCRSCVSQLKRWMTVHQSQGLKHFYKEKSVADWLIDIDYMLSCFPEALEWKMEVRGFRGNQVLIHFNKEVSQKEEEMVAKRLQDFLGTSLDSDLGFFLSRTRQRL